MCEKKFIAATYSEKNKQTLQQQKKKKKKRSHRGKLTVKTVSQETIKTYFTEKSFFWQFFFCFVFQSSFFVV